MKEYLEIGKVVGTHGVRGEMRVEPWCDTPAFLTKFKKLYLQEGASALRVQGARVHKSLVLLKVEGIDTVQDADAMRGMVLWIDRKDVKLPKGRYFIQDLTGLSVLDADSGAVYGTLTDVLRTGANDVYEVTDGEGKTYLVPAVGEVIVSVDLKEGAMRIRPIKGIFDDED